MPRRLATSPTWLCARAEVLCAIADAIGRAVHDVDPTQAISGVSTIEQDVARVLARPRLQAVLVTCFAAVAVALALIGIYGLLAYVVTLRTHEIGIRLALGAGRRRVFMELFGQGALLVCAGVAAGLAAAIGLRQVASTFVFGVTAGDPATLHSSPPRRSVGCQWRRWSFPPCAPRGSSRCARYGSSRDRPSQLSTRFDATYILVNPPSGAFAKPIT